MTGRSETTSVQAKAFVISREFRAPRALVWQAFAAGEQLARWWGPKGFTIAVSKFEFRPDGHFHYRMDGPNGHTMWGRFVYREIAEPERLVFINSFSDDAGTLARAPFFDGTWPLEVLITVTLAEQEGKTLVTLRSQPVGATAVEQAVFESNFDSMTQGFGSALDQLSALLANAQVDG
jgi:uncharacterized protein YndB with AHSA1/START domain